MKRILITLAAALLFIILAAAFSSHSGSPLSSVPEGIPDSVWAVLEKSCYDCHADDGSGFAKGKLNFDKWSSYAPDKQLNRAQAICNEMKKGSMPPGKYVKTNPAAKPSSLEIQRICNWVANKEK